MAAWISEECLNEEFPRHEACEDPMDCACPCHEDDEP